MIAFKAAFHGQIHQAFKTELQPVSEACLTGLFEEISLAVDIQPAVTIQPTVTIQPAAAIQPFPISPVYADGPRPRRLNAGCRNDAAFAEIVRGY